MVESKDFRNIIFQYSFQPRFGHSSRESKEEKRREGSKGEKERGGRKGRKNQFSKDVFDIIREI